MHSDSVDQFHGTGPGTQAQDGSSVELFANTPYFGEIEHLLEFFGPSSHVLEMGCGTGRITRRLLEIGCSVHAVDSCREMLNRVPPTATSIHSDIETLDLSVRFDIALLASGLLNHPDPKKRRRYLDVAHEHLLPDGILLAEIHDPNRLREAKGGAESRSGGIAMTVEQASITGNEAAIQLRYELEGQTWWHTFEAQILEQAAVSAEALAAGFQEVEWLDAKWMRAQA